MDKKSVIQQAIELISNPNNWTIAAYARDFKGDVIPYPKSETAVCWCAAGAIEKYSDTFGTYINIHRELFDFCQHKYGQDIKQINDTLGREKVIEVLKEYLKTLE